MSYPEESKYEYDSKDVEPTAQVNVVGVDEAGESSEDVRLDVHTKLYDGTKRNMKQRHMQMIALAGTLGTGLFLGSGKAIAHGGPAGALLAYMVVGSIVYCMLVSLAEMTVFAPISGGYIEHARRFADPALGFALGWQQVFSGIISLPTELISASILISYWDTKFTIAHQAGWLTMLIILCASINYLGVRWFGESEYIFAMIKIFLIVGLIIAGLIVDLGGVKGQERLGFHYWKDPGAFVEYFGTGSKARFLGWFACLLQAAYSFLGMENIAMAAGECQNPRRAVSRAAKRVFIRIALFYIVGILVVGMLVPSNDSRLLHSTGTAATAPWVLAFSRANIKVLPHIINAGVLTSAFSAGNTGLYGTSRQLYGLALRGQAPRIFAKTTNAGLPIVALTLAVVFSSLCYMSLSSGAATVLNWLSNLTALGGFITWSIISFTYTRFRKGLIAQGINRDDLHYKSFFQPFTAYYVLFWAAVIIFFNGWESFGASTGKFDASSFVVAYINLPLIAALFLGYKFVKKTKLIAPADIDFVNNIPTDEELYMPEKPITNPILKVLAFLFA